ncbi:signal peptidase I SipW [Bacillus sp. CGMCC 1.16607]|uniref:signal peptidase I SipW n=1 Tax=Bacillus sp. CGMCC 1.16607 TaxID=3351842 RepID=UPI00362E263A
MQMKKVKKWIANTITSLLILIFVFMLFLVITAKIAGGEPQFFGYQLKTVLSGSMEPGIKTGSIIAVKLSSENKNFQKNDVITFKAEEDKLITHRIIEVNKNGDQVLYRTKGDNNKSEDMNPVMAENVVAKYTGFTVPYLGYFIDFTKSKNGNLLLLVLPGLLLVAYSALSIWKTIAQLEGKTTNKEIDKTI